jgi:hypothetical protein
MSASAHHLFGMLAMQRRRSGENHRISSFDALAEIPGMMRDCILPGHLGGGLLITAHEARYFHVRYAPKGVHVLLPKGALSSNANLHYTLQRCDDRGGAATPPFLTCIARRPSRTSIRFGAAGRTPADLLSR